MPGQTYEFKVCDIPEDLGDIVFLKVSFDDDGWTDWYPVGDPRCIEFTWTCPPDAYYCNTFVVRLKKGVEEDPCKPKWAAYIVERTLASEDKPAHLHVIPEYAFGTIKDDTFQALGPGTLFEIQKKIAPIPHARFRTFKMYSGGLIDARRDKEKYISITQ